jgi:FkbM family methyltransferase
MNLKSRLRKNLQPVFRFLKWKRYCRMALGELDEKLADYLDFDNGVFIEADANNGIKQSNTYYLEAVRSWRGILVEPVPHLFKECVCNRKKTAKVFNAALVSDEYPGSTVKLTYADLMTMVSADSGNMNFDAAHVSKGKDIQRISQTYDFEAQAMTLNQVIRDSGFKEIDFMSLDLEGYECEALKGLNILKYGPRYIMLEVRDMDAVVAILGEHYKILAELTSGKGYRDILFQRVPKIN